MNNFFSKNILKLLSVLVLSSMNLGLFTYANTEEDILLKERSNNIPVVGIAKVIEPINIEEEKVEEQVEEKETKITQDTKQYTYKNDNQVSVQQPQNTVANNTVNISNILRKNLVKDTGDYFYLNHDINGNYDGIGMPIIDFRTDFNTRKTLIYAHSSPNGNGPFQVLQNYHNNKGYYNANRYITVNYNGTIYTYLIFSVYVSTADSEESEGLEYFRNIYYSDEEWNQTVNWYKSKSEYDTGVSVNSNDKILILQTCSMDSNYLGKYYRANLLIMGKLV